MRLPGRQFYHDPKRQRYVVYRMGNLSPRKTSVRYGATRSKAQARALALRLAHAVRKVPRKRVARFSWQHVF